MVGVVGLGVIGVLTFRFIPASIDVDFDGRVDDVDVVVASGDINDVDDDDDDGVFINIRHSIRLCSRSNGIR